MLKNKLWLVIISSLIISTLILSSCTASTQLPPTVQVPTTTVPSVAEPTKPPAAVPTSTIPVVAEPTKPTAEKNVTITFLTEPDTLNPLYTASWFGQQVNQLNLASLWYFNADGSVMLDLAAEYPTIDNGGISADGKTVTIKLRDNIFWSDGEPITVEDLIFTYDMIMSPKNTVTRYPYDTYIASLKEIDKQTLEMILTENFVDWPYNFYRKGAIIPKHILEPVFQRDGSLDNADWNRLATVSSGPFIVTEWVAGSHMILTANDKYWRGRPKLDHIFIQTSPDRASQNAALASGASDIGTISFAEDTPALKELKNISIETVSAGYTMPLFLNLDPKTANPGLTELPVRQAIVYALNRAQINDEINYGLFMIPVTWWNGTIWDNPKITPLPYDPEKSKSLLDSAAWVDSNGDGTRDKNGVELKLRFLAPPSAIDSGLAVVIQQMLSDVGIGIDITQETMANLWVGYNDNGPLATGQFDMTSWGDGMWYYPSPEIAYFTCDQIPSAENPSNFNFWRICNPRIDELFLKEKTELNQSNRIAMFQEIGQIMHDNTYIIYLFDTPDIYAINTRVINFKLSGANSFYNSFEWDISP